MKLIMILITMGFWFLFGTQVNENIYEEASAEIPVTEELEGEQIPDEEQEEKSILQEFCFPTKDIKIYVEQTVLLSEDTMIESCEWVKESEVLRVRVQYKEQPEENYRHKEDYFFFVIDGEVTQSLYVDYPTKDFENMEQSRYVWEACGFEAHMEDVTFDGREDLIIQLGHAGVHGTMVSCAYVATEDGYRYVQSFEEIPNYEVDVKNQIICGKSTGNAYTYYEYEYRYENQEFVKAMQREYQYNEVTEQYEMVE